jgi:drug/metabolite transporter (DMT)-like permease
MRRIDWLRLLLLAAIWGGSFIFMRVLAPVLGPIVTADVRVLLAGAVLLGWFGLTGFAVHWRRWWKQYLIAGAINSAVPFALFSYAALHIPASYSAIFNSTAPLFGAMFGALWLGEAFSAGRAAGIVFGLAGVVLVSGAGAFEVDAAFVRAALACLAAAACYGLGGVYIKRYCVGVAPKAMAGASQWMAGLLLLPLVPLSPPLGPISGVIIANALALALLCSVVAYLLYYQLMADVGPTRALTVTFLIPGFGLLWGALFLAEQITPGMLAGCGLVLIGTWLVTRPVAIRPAAAVANPVAE